MVTNTPGHGRVIQIQDGIVGPREPRLRSVRPKKIGDYPGVPAPYLAVAKMYSSPLLMGPPLCDELIALVQHIYTEEEASLVRHLRTLPGKTAAAVAAAAHRPVEEVRPVLKRLAFEKFVLFSSGAGDRERYYLLPLMPGAFEAVLVRTSLDTLTDWHRRFAELMEALYETGYFVDYAAHPISTVRYLPVGEAIEAHPMALPSDRLEEVLDPYKVFAVGLCQCRMTQEIVGRGCGRSMENCVGFGDAAELLIRHGKMRRVEKKDVLEIKAGAEAEGLVTWMFETELGKSSSGASCSCCGCCCGALRTISEFNMPGMIAPPHFVPKVDLTQCTYCARCAQACPMGAMVVDVKGKSHRHLTERCIGCGLCAVACDRQHAVQMEPTPQYREPPKSLLPALLQMLPNYLRNAWSVWRKYR